MASKGVLMNLFGKFFGDSESNAIDPTSLQWGRKGMSSNAQCIFSVVSATYYLYFEHVCAIES